MITQIQQMWKVFLTQLRADRKKAIVLGVLGVLLCGVCARMLSSSDPAPAAADALIAAPPANGPTVVLPNAATPTPAAPAHSPAEEPAVKAISIENMARTMQRDLFATDWSSFAPTADAVAQWYQTRSATSRPSPLGSILQRFFTRLGNQQEKTERIRKKIEDELIQLTLQATLLGNPPRAYINGRLLQPGAIIGGFRVVSISAREVILQKSGLNVRLTMP